MLTGGLVFLFSEKIKAFHKPVSTFAAALVATLIFVHILPDVYGGGHPMKWIGLALLLGLVAQLLLEKFTHGVEHNHQHSHARNHKSILIGVMLGLGVHAMIEGMPMLYEEEVHQHHGHDHGESEDDHSGHLHAIDLNKGLTGKFITAVLMHKIPVTIVLSIFLLSLGMSRGRYFLLLSIFALATPVGALLGKSLMGISGISNYTGILVAVSTGMLLHIITSIMFEHGHSRKENNLHIVLILIAVVVGFLLF